MQSGSVECIPHMSTRSRITIKAYIQRLRQFENSEAVWTSFILLFHKLFTEIKLCQCTIIKFIGMVFMLSMKLWEDEIHSIHTFEDVLGIHRDDIIFLEKRILIDVLIKKSVPILHLNKHVHIDIKSELRRIESLEMQLCNCCLIMKIENSENKKRSKKYIII